MTCETGSIVTYYLGMTIGVRDEKVVMTCKTRPILTYFLSKKL